MSSTKTLLEWECELLKANSLVIELPRWQQISPNANIAVPANLKVSDRRPLIVREREAAAAAQAIESDVDDVPRKTPLWLALPVQVFAVCIFGALAICAVPVMIGFGILTLLAEGSGRIVNWLKGGSW